ncbi:hypothetical protein [uncultured Hydrogenophaga sp.]|uniref:hypothetical protein n=1 Tax=uncultured Hydrogenophaga sp. TaxID=199683 RepID=UPI00258D1ED3|nr:hypothetical protein [uncultured Hydrogenophaga sp.]
MMNAAQGQEHVAKKSKFTAERIAFTIKQIEFDLRVDKVMLQALVKWGGARPTQRRDFVPESMQRFGCSTHQALGVVFISTATNLYASRRKDESSRKPCT